MTIRKTSQSQSKSQKKGVVYPFCRQPWHIGAMLLGVCYIFTLVWAFHLLHDDLDESLNFLSLGKAGSSRDEVPANRVVTAALHTAIAALPPGTVPADLRVRAALVNIAGIRPVNGGTPGPFVSVGSGVLVTANGYVVTAAHLVAGLQEILVRVQTPSGPRQYTAQVVKSIPTHDVAVLKLVSRDLFPYLPLAPETVMLKVGEPVVAWGDSNSTNAMANRGQVRQVDATVTVGGLALTHLLQTDAVVHWFQSGGPLLDAQGRMVGINVAVQAAPGTGGLVGYAVPTSVLWGHFQDVVTFPSVAPPPAQPWQGGGVPTPVAGGTDPNARMVPVAAQMGNTQMGNTQMGNTQMGNTQMGNTQMGNGMGGGQREARRADAWWAKARATYGLAPQGGVPAPAVNPPLVGQGQALGLHAAMVQPPVMVPAAHLSEPLFWGYPLKTLSGLLALGLISGISGGMMTMGGGIIKVTGLMLFFGYGLLLIRPVAYITNIFLYGAAVLRYRRYELILWDSVRGLIPWAMVGVVMGYFLGNVMGSQWIRYLLGLFAALVGVRMLVEILSGRGSETRPDGLSVGGDGVRRQSWFYYLGLGQPPAGTQAPVANGVARDGILGLPMGVISGILGITGGVIEVPLQRYVAGVPLRNAIANSAVLVFFASLVGSIVAMTHGIQTGAFDWSAPIKLAIILIPGAYAGGLIGAWLNKVVPLGVLRWLYAVLMFVIAGRMFMP